jgi:hypothetical protein
VNVLELTLDDGNRITGHSGENRPMGESVAEAPEYKALVDAFNKKYEAMEKESGIKKAPPIQP